MSDDRSSLYPLPVGSDFVPTISPDIVNPLTPPATVPTVAPSLVNSLAPTRTIPAGPLSPMRVVNAPSVTPSAAPSVTPSAVPQSMTLVRGESSKDDPRGMIPVIRSAAIANGIDPDVAIRVARSEGLGGFRSGITRKDGTEEPSWGAFQLNTDGGMGNDFQRDTKLDPSDPANEEATIWYAMDKARQGGWGPWHGAKNTGIAQWDGIKKGFTPTMRPQYASAADVAAQPSKPDQPTTDQPTAPPGLSQPPGALGMSGLMALAMGMASRRFGAAPVSYDPWAVEQVGRQSGEVPQQLSQLMGYSVPRIGSRVPGPAPYTTTDSASMSGGDVGTIVRNIMARRGPGHV